LPIAINTSRMESFNLSRVLSWDTWNRWRKRELMWLLWKSKISSLNSLKLRGLRITGWGRNGTIRWKPFLIVFWPSARWRGRRLVRAQRTQVWEMPKLSTKMFSNKLELSRRRLTQTRKVKNPGDSLLTRHSYLCPCFGKKSKILRFISFTMTMQSFPFTSMLNPIRTMYYQFGSIC
jgi:hypothetical protein